MKLLDELKRRNVFRVAAVYTVVGWLLVQVVVSIEAPLSLPAWTDTLVIVLLGVGFPVAVVLAWAFEITPEGVKPTRDMDDGSSIAGTGRTLDHAILAGLALVVVAIAADRLAPEPAPAPAPTATVADNAPAVAPAGDTAAPSAASIAVLPFADLSPAGDQAYFADGVSEEILNVLAKTDGLKVASRTSSFAFRDQGDIGARAIAKELAVRHLLEGSVRKSGDTLRITAQLIDAADDRHLWSETYDRPLTAENVFAIQDEIAGAIVGALGNLLEAAPRRTHTVAATSDLSAYDLYLEARALYQARSRIDRAEALLAQSVERDPGFADAWALRAACASLFKEFAEEDVSWQELETRVDRYSARALSLDPDNALAIAAPANFRMNATLGLAARHDIAAIVAELDRAIGIDPRNSSARNWLGMAQMAVGEGEKALATFSACAEFDPLFGPCTENAYEQLVALERYDEAWTLFQRVLSRGMMVEGWVNFSLLAHFEEKTAFMIAADQDQWLPGWRRHDEIYAAFRSPDDDHGALASAAAGFVRDNLAVNEKRIGSLLIPIGAWDFRPYPTTLWAPDHARYRQSAQFMDFIDRTGIHDYWRAQGFPPQCRPLGADAFACD